MNIQSEDRSENWGPFERPLFDDPSVRALSRVGVVDVGSNSVRLVVFDGAARSPAYFYNEKIMCGLGAGVSRDRAAEPRRAQTRAVGAEALPRAVAGHGAFDSDRGGDGRRARCRRRQGVLRGGASGKPACASGSSMARKRRGCRHRAFCWAGRDPTASSATSADPRWSWPRSAAGSSGGGSPRRSVR